MGIPNYRDWDQAPPGLSQPWTGAQKMPGTLVGAGLGDPLPFR